MGSSDGYDSSALSYGSLDCRQRTSNWMDIFYGKDLAYNLELARQIMIPPNFQIQSNWISRDRRSIR